MNKNFFVTGTDTGVGKTVLSALLCAALDAFYWKPIQTGTCEGTDRQTVARLARLDEHRSVPESYCFDPPVSPHLAASQAGRQIDLSRIRSIATRCCRPSTVSLTDGCSQYERCDKDLASFHATGAGSSSNQDRPGRRRLSLHRGRPESDRRHLLLVGQPPWTQPPRHR